MTRSNIRNMQAGRLPRTYDEAKAVEKRWQEVTGEPCSLLLGIDASERKLAELAPGKRVLHLATHGFYALPDQQGMESEASLGVSGPQKNSLLRAGKGVLTQKKPNNLFVSIGLANLNPPKSALRSPPLYPAKVIIGMARSALTTGLRLVVR